MKPALKPSSEALGWIIDSVGAGALIESTSPLPGATSTALHRVRINYKGSRLDLVLRQFVDTQWLALEPDLALHEAAALVKAASASIPTPELIAYDEKGSYCGAPSTLMTLLPGRVELMPVDLDRWLDPLAASIIPIHELEVKEFPWSYYPYCDISRLAPPVWSNCPELWERAIEVVTGPRPQARECFIHRDYHPNNVLWQENRVSGIIDWVNACRGPAGIDVAWCRQNLAQLYGVEEADRFLSLYRRFAGTSFDYQPYWDLIAAIEFLPGPPGVYGGWSAFGVDHLDKKTIVKRVDAYLASIVNFL